MPEVIQSPYPRANMECSVEWFQECDASDWDAFVHAHPHGSPFHLIAWRQAIVETFGYKPVYLIARHEGKVRGVLPLFLIRNPVIGKALISSPFAVYGGILADGDGPRHAVYERAKLLGRELGVDYIEFRNAFPEQCVGEANVSRYVAFSQAVVAGEEAILQSLPKKT